MWTHRITCTLLLLVSGLLASEATHSAAFRAPPAEARPHVFWYWMQGNISREGLTADLEAMQRAGIGGAMIFNIGGGHGPRGPVKVLSPEWRELMRHALREAGRLGIEITLNNSMLGWSASGGPWIPPEKAMQRVTWSTLNVEGGNTLSVDLPQPTTVLDHYREIAVLAFPTPAAELAAPKAERSTSDPGFDWKLVATDCGGALGENWDSTTGKPAPLAVLNAAAGREAYVQWTYAEPFPARTLSIDFGRAGGTDGRVQASDDGSIWREVLTFRVRSRAPVHVAFSAPPARRWRVLFATQAQAAKIQLAGIDLGSRARITDWTAKAMFDPYGLDKPPFTLPTDPPPPVSAVIPAMQIVDLTSRMNAAGQLRWNVPPGQWTILRFGSTPTGSRVGPGFAEAPGLECDKLDPEALRLHWRHSLQPWFDDPELNAIVKNVHLDSYERGAQNWTAQLPAEFQQRRGYDPRRFLPILTGRVIDSVSQSERFLWDFRNVVTGMMHDHYFGQLGKLCREAGKRFSLEPYHQTQFNNLTAGSHADIPMCEAWVGDSIPGPQAMKLGASPAHVYGKRLVAAEAFTARAYSGGNWSTDFAAIKELGDAMFCGGVNRLVFHVYVHQPWKGLVPGQTLAVFGTHFERTNTWWEQMPAFTGYLSRCQTLLQQGRPVADVLYSCGENNPTDQDLGPSGAMTLPRGYDYDVCDPFVIFHRLTVKDGRLFLPEGGSYRLLVLPDDPMMTPAMLRRIGELVAAGAVVVGPKPERSPSLRDQPRADQEVREWAEKIWGDCDGRKAKQRTYGQGRIFWGRPLAEILPLVDLAPDFEAGAENLVRHVHRQLDAAELYYVAASPERRFRTEAVFRTGRGKPQLWNPLDGSIRDLPIYRHEAGRTIIPLEFEPRQSYFIVFAGRESDPLAKAAAGNFPAYRILQPITGEWEVNFSPARGGPERIIFGELQDWSQRLEAGIKYYSGSATYRKRFDRPGVEAGARLFLDLGKVRNVATVRLNGTSLGILWCQPWRVEITDQVRARDNLLEIDVVNLWTNRLIGDEQLPADCSFSPGIQHRTGAWRVLTQWPDWMTRGEPRPSGRITFATINHFTPDSPLLESGLLGPVTLQEAALR